MTKGLYSVLVAFLMLIWGFSAAAQTQTADPAEEIRKMLTERDRKIKSVLGDKKSFTEQQRERLQELINSVIDFQAMAQMALGPHWKEIAPAQREEFVDVFSQIVRTQSLSDLNVYRADFTYDRIEVKGDSAHVFTSTVYDGTPLEVEYVLGYKDDQWRVHDIVIDEVSTAKSYARSFQTVIRKRGFETLMTSLNKKLDKIKANS